MFLWRNSYILFVVKLNLRQITVNQGIKRPYASDGAMRTDRESKIFPIM